MNLENTKKYLANKIPQDEIDGLIFLASGILCQLKRVDSIDKLPQSYDYWIYRAVLELKNREGFEGAARYSENGYSIDLLKGSELVGEIDAYVSFTTKT